MALLDGLVAFWLLDEASGTSFADSSGNGNTLSGTVSFGSGVCSGSAVKFANGTAEALLAPSSGNLAPAGAFYFAGFFYTGNSAQTGPIVSKSEVFPASADYELVYSVGARELIWTVRKADNSADVSVTFGTVLTASTWYFFECYYDGTNIGVAATVPGSAMASFTTAANAFGVRQSTGDFGMGARPGVGSYHANADLVSHIGLWQNHTLTQEERELLSGYGTGGCPLAWPFPSTGGGDGDTSGGEVSLGSGAPSGNLTHSMTSRRAVVVNAEHATPFILVARTDRNTVDLLDKSRECVTKCVTLVTRPFDGANEAQRSRKKRAFRLIVFGEGTISDGTVGLIIDGVRAERYEAIKALQVEENGWLLVQHWSAQAVGYTMAAELVLNMTGTIRDIRLEYGVCN